MPNAHDWTKLNCGVEIALGEETSGQFSICHHRTTGTWYAGIAHIFYTHECAIIYLNQPELGPNTHTATSTTARMAATPSVLGISTRYWAPSGNVLVES